jgi:hypothetical protein
MLKTLVVLTSLWCVSLASADASELVYNRASSQLVLLDKKGKVVGKWEARNNVGKNVKPFPGGTYRFFNRKTHEDDNPNSAYGSHGIMLFQVPRRTDLGVHSGRMNAKTNPGPAHPTQGSIRTTDAAMQAIVTLHLKDRVSRITVR